MKVAVIGSRNFTDYNLAKETLDEINYKDFIEYFVKKFQVEVLENEGNN